MFPPSLRDFDRIFDHLEGDFSPENLCCDGESTDRETQERYDYLTQVKTEAVHFKTELYGKVDGSINIGMPFTDEQRYLLKLAEDADSVLLKIETAMATRINPEKDPVVTEITDGIGDVRQMRRQIKRWTNLIEDWKPVQ